MGNEIKLRRMKDFTPEELKELKDWFDVGIYKAHLNGDWISDKVLEIEERYQNKSKNCPECRGESDPKYDDLCGDGYRVCSVCSQEYYMDVEYKKE